MPGNDSDKVGKGHDVETTGCTMELRFYTRPLDTGFFPPDTGKLKDLKQENHMSTSAF